MDLDIKLIQTMLSSGKSLSEIARALNTRKSNVRRFVSKDSTLLSIKNNNRLQAFKTALEDMKEAELIGYRYLNSMIKKSGYDN